MGNRKALYFKYAIGEVILVMIGILLALQVNNWNEDRNDRKKEKSMVAEIYDEFVNNKAQLFINTAEHGKRLENIKKAVDLLPINLKTVNLDSLSRYIDGSLGYWTFEPSQGTINSLVNSSNLDLIKNNELRKALILWQSVFEDYREDELIANSYTFNYLFPYLEKHFNWDIDLNDKRTDLSSLETFEFENILLGRMQNLTAILDSEERELQTLEELIDTIIRLTKLEK